MHENQFFVLTLTPHTARLYEATRSSIHQIESIARKSTPAESGGGDGGTVAASDNRSGRARRRRRFLNPSDPSAGADCSAADIVGFFRQIDQCVSRTLEGRQSPLVLACVGYLALIYHAANTYRWLVRGKIPGNPDGWTVDELRDNGWRIVAPCFQDEQASNVVRVGRYGLSSDGGADRRHPPVVIKASNDHGLGMVAQPRGIDLAGLRPILTSAQEASGRLSVGATAFTLGSINVEVAQRASDG